MNETLLQSFLLTAITVLNVLRSGEKFKSISPHEFPNKVVKKKPNKKTLLLLLNALHICHA